MESLVQEQKGSKVYALKQEQGKFYIGWTDRLDSASRIQEHFENGGGCEWTRLYKPLECIHLEAGTQRDEDRITLEYMRKYGWRNVRGGRWSQVQLLRPPAELYPATESPLVCPSESASPSSTPVSATQSCYQCGETGHWSRHCPHPRDCLRCGQKGHISEDCTVDLQTCVARCFRCNGVGHWSRTCTKPIGVHANACYTCGQIGHWTKTCPTVGTA